MKYCITAAERCGTCYHEFQRGKFGKFFWNKTQFWEEDSLLLQQILIAFVVPSSIWYSTMI